MKKISAEPLIWDAKETSNGIIHFCDTRFDAVIFKKDSQWTLTYNDFWTTADRINFTFMPSAFVVSVSQSGDDNTSLKALKLYAEKAFKEFCEYVNSKNNEISETEL